jgi:ABC-type amino acid transport substrate-binding protein
MGISDRSPLLNRRMGASLCVVVMGIALQGCGLVVDAVQLIYPISTDDLETICSRGRLHVGMAIEPRRPFVFPAIYTDEGLRVTGMDVELVREIAGALSRRCKNNQPITPVLNLVRFRDLFVQLNEGKLDLFVSGVSANIPSLGKDGLAYSTPYFYDGGIGAITQRPELSERLRAHRQEQLENPGAPALLKKILTGATVAVQEGTSAQLYAETNLTGITLVVCDSLPAAFESQDPVIDVILSQQPVLQFIVSRVRKDWQQISLETGKPVTLTREQYAVVMAEGNYRLRWFVNDFLFQLDDSGRLAKMQRRWLEEDYAFPRRAAAEGLPFDVGEMVAHYDQGTCRVRPGR